jgi:hypothetical protein
MFHERSFSGDEDTEETYLTDSSGSEDCVQPAFDAPYVGNGSGSKMAWGEAARAPHAGQPHRSEAHRTSDAKLAAPTPAMRIFCLLVLRTYVPLRSPGAGAR